MAGGSHLALPVAKKPRAKVPSFSVVSVPSELASARSMPAVSINPSAKRLVNPPARVGVAALEAARSARWADTHGSRLGSLAALNYAPHALIRREAAEADLRREPRKLSP